MVQNSNNRATKSPATPTRAIAPSALLSSAFGVGVIAGGGGLLLGGAQGIILSGSPPLFAVLAGVQWFTAGSAYWAARTAVLNRRGLRAWFDVERGVCSDVGNVDSFSRTEKVRASTIAGGLSGGIVAAVARSRSHIIPGTVMFSVFAYVGQHLYDSVLSRRVAHEADVADEPAQGKRRWLQRLVNSHFNPVQVLSEDEYEQMLREKLLRIQVEIALVDESIEKLQRPSQHSDSAEH